MTGRELFREYPSASSGLLGVINKDDRPAELIMSLKSHVMAIGALLRPVLFSAAFSMGVSSAAFALDTAYGQNTHDFKEQADIARHTLESAGYSEVTDLKLLKHGFAARAVKDGKPVKVEINERDGIELQQDEPKRWAGG
jgi:hypothetical protein